MSSYEEEQAKLPQIPEPSGGVSVISSGDTSSDGKASSEREIWWNIPVAVGVWFLSLVLLLLLQFILLAGYFFYDPKFIDSLRQGVITPPAAIISLVGTFLAQILTLVISWFVVTEMGRRSFNQVLGMQWHPRFRWPQAIVLSILALGWAILCSKLLPHKETDLEKLLTLGLGVRILLAFLATIAAPIVEEVLYRGILYPAFEKYLGSVAGIVLVMLMFWLVHVPQYWGSWAVLAALLGLSLALTILRAKTGKLLPCVVVHFIFNGLQAIGIIFYQEPSPKETLQAMMCHAVDLLTKLLA
jgi:hypothetical protein